MSYARGCDECEAEDAGAVTLHNVLDPGMGAIGHRQVIASGDHWTVEVTAAEGDDSDGFLPGFSEHSVELDCPPSALSWHEGGEADLLALSAALASAAVRLVQVQEEWSVSPYNAPSEP